MMIDWRTLAKAGLLKKYRAGEIFFEAGAPGNEAFLILSGSAEYIHPDGKFASSLCKAGPGKFIGEGSLLFGTPHIFTAKALEDTTVIVFDREGLKKIIREYPELVNWFRKESIELHHYKRVQQATPAPQEEIKQDNNSEKSHLPKPSSITAEDMDEAKLIPPAHKKYSLQAPASHADYLYDKTVSCPICGQKFATKAVRRSKLRPLKTEPDLRKLYSGFEPLWYAISVCPYCRYANFASEFEQLTEAQKKFIGEKCPKAEHHAFVFGEPREIDEVFSAYYRALFCLKAAGENFFKAATIWLNLSWLYHDVNDEEMYLFASEQALENLKKGYYQGRQDILPQQEQRINFLFGELLTRLGNEKEAIKYFRNAIVRNGGNKEINECSEDRILTLREKAKAAKTP